MAAWGVQAAVADLFTEKGGAMKAYTESIGIDPDNSGGAAQAKTPEGAKLGKRIQSLLSRGEL